MTAATNLDTPVRLVPLREVMARIGYKRTTIYTLIKNGTFPRPVKAGVGKSSRWVLSEIERYVAKAVAARDRQRLPQPPKASRPHKHPTMKRAA